MPAELVIETPWPTLTLTLTLPLSAFSPPLLVCLVQLDGVKAKRSLKSIQNLCPDLSMTQLAHICTWFEDDKEGLPGWSRL